MAKATMKTIEPKGAVEPKPGPSGMKLVRVVIGTSALGEDAMVRCPDPRCDDGTKWLTIPRNEPVEIEELVANRLRKKYQVVNLPVKDENGNLTGKRRKVKYPRFPITEVPADWSPEADPVD